jgi:hypothetical protein
MNLRDGFFFTSLNVHLSKIYDLKDGFHQSLIQVGHVEGCLLGFTPDKPRNFKDLHYKIKQFLIIHAFIVL